MVEQSPKQDVALRVDAGDAEETSRSRAFDHSSTTTTASSG
jgi:hypothetical protein